MCDSTETPGSAPALAKFGLHLPLNRQSAVAREGIDLDVSPLAYWAGAAAVPLTRWSKRSAPMCSQPRASMPT
jgi:hypothetical protein